MTNTNQTKEQPKEQTQPVFDSTELQKVMNTWTRGNV